MPQSLNRAAPIEQTAWEFHKPRIIQLWTDPDHTLASLKRIMEREKGFIATKRQYHRQLHDIWRIRKNFTSDELEYIGKVTRERRAQGKKTRVKRNGVCISEANIKRRQSRPYVKTIDLKRREIAAKIGPGSVGTPTEVDESSPTPLSGLLSTTDEVELHAPIHQLDQMNIDIHDASINTRYQSYSDDAEHCYSTFGSYNAASNNRSTGEIDVKGTTICPYGTPLYESFDTDSTWDTSKKEIEQAASNSSDACDAYEDSTDDALQETISNGLKMIHLVEDRSEPDSPDHPSHSRNISGEEGLHTEDMPLSQYARLHEPEFLDYIAFEQEEAQYFVDTIASLSKNTGLSIEEIDCRFHRLADKAECPPLPYRVYEQITGNRVIGSDLGASVDGIFGNLLSKLMDLKFADLQHYVYQPPNLRWRKDFDAVVVHLPRFISQFGFFHYHTAHALQKTSRLVALASEGGNARVLMLNWAILIYEKLEMSHYPEALQCWFSILSRESGSAGRAADLKDVNENIGILSTVEMSDYFCLFNARAGNGFDVNKICVRSAAYPQTHPHDQTCGLVKG
ncbi:hypothetical protein TWF281_004201 [Arthrobotrys megalospora]